MYCFLILFAYICFKIISPKYTGSKTGGHTVRSAHSSSESLVSIVIGFYGMR